MDREVLERILDGREKPTNLSLALLKDITENFSDDREIGHGGFATVYKGVLRNGNVAVKRIRNSHSINETLFYREVDSLLNIKHKNVVRFLGFCASTDQIAIQIAGSKRHIYAEVRERLLCFEYISNGSLQKYVTDELRGLEWNTRYGIIRGICEGLHHLHTEKHIYHMDLKPGNILLDNDMVPKITDFGLSRLDEKSKTMSEYRLGSLGYCAPEYISEGNMSFKSDMYSLGKIIIELVTGGKEILNNSNTVLRRWRHRWKKSGKETPLVYQQVAKCIEIGLLCQEREPSKRPFIWDIINDISHMEVVNEEINNANEYTFGKISSCLEEDDMLGIEPLKLHFPFALNKQMSCEIQLTNETDSYIAFNVQNMSPKSYNTQPQKDIMPPRSKCNIEITLQAQGNVLIDMQHANEFVVWSTKVNDGIAFEDITKSMFIKETINVVDEVNLDVVFDVSEPQEASDKISEGNALTDRANESTVWSTKVMIDGLAIEDITTNKLIKEADTMVDEVHLDVVFDANETFEEHSAAIMALKFNPADTNSFASASHDTTIKLLYMVGVQVWSLDSPKSKYTLFGHRHVVNFLDFFTREGQQYLISGSWDATAKIWDMDKKECVHTLEHESAVFQVVSHPNLPVLITGTKDGDVHAWSSNDFRLKRIHNFHDSGWVVGLACLVGSGRLVVAHKTGVSLMEIRDEEEQGGSTGSNDNSLSATNLDIQS
ncbi:probable serine/threonine-protein kinase CA_C1728 [Triticum aestivum]|uniref:probable serine/threonine-protein kinase CA_C1728 n=1 Tax=Triticum aestivum TaxID=4565 RepID=UPI001D016A20|nr:probable serine/threonine-protein kinase CA_C1728 [Triticum aestivum]